LVGCVGEKRVIEEMAEQRKEEDATAKGLNEEGQKNLARLAEVQK